MHIWEVAIRILIAAVLGGVIGIEREFREHTAGFRTHILVAVGAAAFTLASSYGLTGTNFDPNRISAQVVTGIGFLGAGAIIRYGASVRGLTTAASLWTVAAVGLLAAQGFYSAALVTTAVVIASLYLLRIIEDRLLFPRRRHSVEVIVHFGSPGYGPLSELVTALRNMRIEVKEISVSQGEDPTDTVHLLIDLPRGVDNVRLAALLGDVHAVRSFRIEGPARS
jgi:putative Mg2+ transporter-C (MgtC) family protein